MKEMKELKGKISERVREGNFVLKNISEMTLMEFAQLQTNSNRLKMKNMIDGFANKGTPSSAMVIVYTLEEPTTKTLFREFDKVPVDGEFPTSSNFAKLSSYGSVKVGMSVWCETITRPDGKAFLKISAQLDNRTTEEKDD